MDIDLNVGFTSEEYNLFESIYNEDALYKSGFDEIPFDDLPDDNIRIRVDEEIVDDQKSIHSANDDDEVSVGDGSDGGHGSHINEDGGDGYPGNGDTEDCDEFIISLSNSIEKRLEVGSVVDSLDQAYLLYCEYGRLKGFSVKKGTQDYFYKTTEIRLKTYNCSCHGQSNQGTSVEGFVTFKKQVHRTDCKARLLVVRKRNGPWKVMKFDKEHNHELVPYDQTYLLRSCRQMTHASKSLIEALNSAGIKISNACRFLEKESGGANNIGFTRKDAYNHMSSLKQKTKVENADADALRNYFLKKANHESFFYWDAQSDSDGRLMNFFFRDYRCALDYEYFGDVMCVDTTHKTNKYKLVCAPFVGINHHKKNVLFGMGFLSHEDTASFDWLFSTFLDSMYSKEPDVIFSDECRALMKGIDYNFKTSSHRLCQWHLNRNAPSFFGKWKGNQEFKRQWHRCVNGCESAEEFEKEWNLLIEKYELSEKSKRWFNKQYKLRRRWSTAFTRDRFCAGLQANSRVEVTNKVIKDLCCSSGSLHDFVLGYEEVLRNWRRQEHADDTLCIGVPGQFIQNNKLLNQTAQFFTRNVFKLYEVEQTCLINAQIIKQPNDPSADVLEYSILADIDHGRTRTLMFYKADSSIKCSCHMWETKGVLCRHIFRVFLDLNVEAIPERYLLKRYSRAAKQRNCKIFDPRLVKEVGAETVENLSFVSHVMRDTFDLVEFAKNNPKCRSLILEQNARVRAEVYRTMGLDPSKIHIPNLNRSSFDNGVRFCNPPLPKRGVNANSRMKRHWEETKTNRPRKTTEDISKDHSLQASQAAHSASSFASYNSTFLDQFISTTNPFTPSSSHIVPVPGWTHSSQYDNLHKDPLFPHQTQ